MNIPRAMSFRIPHKPYTSIKANSPKGFGLNGLIGRQLASSARTTLQNIGTGQNTKNQDPKTHIRYPRALHRMAPKSKYQGSGQIHRS
jgi:hypothetical protein